MNKSLVLLLFIALFICSACTAKEDQIDSVAVHAEQLPNERHAGLDDINDVNNDVKDEIDVIEDVLDLKVNHYIAVSSDGRYRVESYGIIENITSGGLYSAEGIRLIDNDTEVELWSMTPGYYVQSFLWSPNDRYVAIYVEARTYGETIVVDTQTMTELSLPTIEQLRHSLNTATLINEDRADPYFKFTEWLSDAELEVTFQWTGEDGEGYEGTFIHDVSEDILRDVQL